MAAPRPIKGILKNKGSGTPAADAEKVDTDFLDDENQKKSQKWDEMNILATYHPADKDYGLMKIDEPSTPYNRVMGEEDDEGAQSDSECNSGLTPEELSRKLAAVEETGRHSMTEEEEESSEEEEEEELSPEQQAKKKQFEMMRKLHYNEGLNIQKARQLIASELEEDEDDDEDEEEGGGVPHVDEEMVDVSEERPQDAKPHEPPQQRCHGRLPEPIRAGLRRTPSRCPGQAANLSLRKGQHTRRNARTGPDGFT